MALIPVHYLTVFDRVTTKCTYCTIVYSVGCCIKNYQDGRVLCYYVSNISYAETDIFMYVLRWYVDMFTTIATYSCMATDIFIVL